MDTIEIQRIIIECYEQLYAKNFENLEKKWIHSYHHTTIYDLIREGEIKEYLKRLITSNTKIVIKTSPKPQIQIQNQTASQVNFTKYSKKI